MRATCVCRIQERLKIPAEEFSKWGWVARATTHSPPQHLRDPEARVVHELDRAAGSVTSLKANATPYLSMVHESKGHAARRGVGYGQGEAQIRMQ